MGLHNKGIRRSVGSHQLKLRHLYFRIDGTIATPVEGGFDEFQISSVVDLGAGNYTIIFAKAQFERACEVAGHAMYTADAALEVTAVAKDRVTVQCTDLAGAAQDADFSLCVVGSDARYNV